MNHAHYQRWGHWLLAHGTKLWIGLLFYSGAWVTAEAASRFPSSTAKGKLQNPPSVRVLEVGQPIERELAGGETHTYHVTLEVGQIMRALIDQHGIDVVVAIYNPAEKKLAEVDRPNGVRGPEAISVIADASGQYRLIVRSLQRVAAPGRYQVSLKELRPSTQEDVTRLAAERAVAEGERLRARETAESLRQAITQFDLALKLWRSLQERYEEAIALYGLGWSHNTLGEYQQAIHYFSQSNLLMQAEQSLEGSSQSQKGLAWAYLYMGEIEQAREYFSQALQIDQKLGNARGAGIALYGLGWVACFAKDNQQALDYFSRALAIRQELKDRRGEALALAGVARIYRRLDDKKPEALDYLQRALRLLRETGDQNGEADMLANLGWVCYSLRQDEQALRYFEQALQLSIAIGDRPCQATTHYGIAALADRKGQLREACRQMEAALEIVESLRSRGTNQQLRASYLSATQEYYDLYIQTLMKLDQLYPTEGHAATALQASERSRARSLLETLLEASIDLRRGVAATLLEREQRVQQWINDKAFRRRQLLAAKQPEQAASVSKEIETLTAELQQILAQIREQSPQYAALMQPTPITLQEMQQQLLAPDTLLLEYSLIDTQSYLWVVSSNALTSFVLPNRAEIEAAALQVYKLLTARNQTLAAETSAGRQKRIAQADAEFPAAAARLSQMLLGPAADLLGRKRLLIIADGVLQFIPFGVLPTPVASLQPASQSHSSYQPLIVAHEIVSLPSASTLTVLRRELAQRQSAPKTVAVLADPVFEETDGRVLAVGSTLPDSKTAAPTVDSTERQRLRDVRQAVEDVGAEDFQRLVYTRWEANRIAALVPAGKAFKALDFKASRTTALSPELSQYRIVHFASHSIINNVHPELSGIVLSLVDNQGRLQDGFLRAHEIYNLKLPAELIVLSACRTGIGKQVRGEGLISLTRGFMYAGASRVGVNLWSVEDRATAELMVKFYRQMLGQRRLSAAAALRVAQLEMWRDKQFTAPYFWAGFVLQGEWK
jgi:CHAT domain-containing protein/tetratricopeptide (TPR) repeat protein